MDHADHMRQSIELAVRMIRGAGPARYGDPSPCAAYTVGQVVNHLAFGFLLAQRAAERQPWDPEWAGDDRAPFLAGVPEEQWAELAARHGEATALGWADPAAWAGETTFGGGAMPAAAVGSMMTVEFAAHAWDVAAATGQAIPMTDGLAATVLDGVAAIAPMGREGGWFAAEVDVPPGAPEFERALAAAGRDPRWTP